MTNLATQWIHTFDPSKILEARFGFNISDDLTSNPRTDNSSFDMDALGVGQFRIPGDGNRKLTRARTRDPEFRRIAIYAFRTNRGKRYDNMDTYQPSAHFTWMKGSTLSKWAPNTTASAWSAAPRTSKKGS